MLKPWCPDTTASMQQRLLGEGVLALSQASKGACQVFGCHVPYFILLEHPGRVEHRASSTVHALPAVGLQASCTCLVGPQHMCFRMSPPSCSGPPGPLQRLLPTLAVLLARWAVGEGDAWCCIPFFNLKVNSSRALPVGAVVCA